MTEYKVYRTVKSYSWCEVEADNEKDAIQFAEQNDVWYGSDDDNYDDEFEVEIIG